MERETDRLGQVMDNLSLKCRNCNSNYSSSARDLKHVPLVLLCGCTFCAGCLAQLCRGGGVTCPQCTPRRKTPISADSDIKEQLPPNYYLLGRITARNLKLRRFPISPIFSKFISSTSTSIATPDLDISPAGIQLHKPRCEECGALGNVLCQQCDGVYCDGCFKKVHMSSNSMRRHISVPLSQISQSGLSYCPSHQSLLLDYYCSDDGECICSQCYITGEHKGHEVIPLKQIAESQREKLLPLLKEARNRVRMLRTGSESADIDFGGYRKKMNSELALLEKQFSRSYALLQVHQKCLIERLCSSAIDAITPLKNMQTEIHAQIQSLTQQVKVAERVLNDDYELMKESSSLIDSLTCGVQLPLTQWQLNDVTLPKLTFDLRQFFIENVCTPTSDPSRSELDGTDIPVVVSGVASPAHPVTTPTSSRPPSAQSECYLSGAVVGSERGSRASSYRSVSPASTPRKPHLPVHKVSIEDTIEVWICHVVSVGEFYIQCPGQRQSVDQLSPSLSSLSPGPLSAEGLKEGVRCVCVSAEDEKWYRAVVTSAHLSPPVHATVKLIDCGRMEDLPLTRLYELPFDLSNGPPQCVECCLHAVHPPKVRYQHHVTPTLWSPNTNNIFTALVNAKNFRMKVYCQPLPGVLSVDLLSFNGLGMRGEGGRETSRGFASEAEGNEFTSVIDQLIERGVVVLDKRKWEESGSRPVNLGAGDCMDVSVPTAENPWDFCVHLVVREENRQRIAEMLNQNVGWLCPLTLTPYRNMLCCCEYSEDAAFYRGRVKEVCGDGAHVVIEFIDYGNSERVSREKLFELPGDLLTTPIEAIHCRLEGVQPVVGSSEHQSRWSEDISDEFNELIGFPIYTMTVKATGMPLTVKLVDKETGQSLADLLVEKKLAEYSLRRSPSKSPSTGIELSSLVQPNSTPLLSKLPLSRHLDMTGELSPSSLAPTTPPTAIAIPPAAIPPVATPPTAIPPSAIPRALLPAVGETITGKVVHISSPTHFCVQRLDTGHGLLSQLNTFKAVKVNKPHRVQPGAACLARFHDDEGYHRVIVMSVNSSKVEVCYVDYGNSAELPLDQIYPLTPELKSQPALAVLCSLTREIPQHMLPVFSELVVDKTLSVTVKGVDGGPPTVLLVSLVNEDGEDIEEKLHGRISPLSPHGRQTPPLSPQEQCSVPTCRSDTTASPELTTLTVCVTYLSIHGEVYGHNISPNSSTTDNLRAIEEAIDRVCSSLSPPLAPPPCSTPQQLQSGQYVCAKSEDGSWYRATINSLQDTTVKVFFIDYGNCETVPRNDIIPVAIRPDLSSQAVGVNFTSLVEYLLSQPGERQTIPPAFSSDRQIDIVSAAVLTDDQYTSLSQQLIDQHITMEIRGTDDRGLLIASCDVIDKWIEQDQTRIV